MKTFRLKVTYSHCLFCDTWGLANVQKHPMIQRMMDLEREGQQVTMNWENCRLCVEHGAPEKTKMTVECEINIPYEMG